MQDLGWGKGGLDGGGGTTRDEVKVTCLFSGAKYQTRPSFRQFALTSSEDSAKPARHPNCVCTHQMSLAIRDAPAKSQLPRRSRATRLTTPLMNIQTSPNTAPCVCRTPKCSARWAKLGSETFIFYISGFLISLSLA